VNINIEQGGGKKKIRTKANLYGQKGEKARNKTNNPTHYEEGAYRTDHQAEKKPKPRLPAL